MDWSEILKLIGDSQRLLVKKLARNDCSWADDPGKHQYGIYIPQKIRESGFFPPLTNTNPEKPHIFEVQFQTMWSATGEVRNSSLKHYSNKGTEMHFTGVPKDQFTELTPASLLLGGLFKQPHGETRHWFLVLDSASEEAELLETIFNLEADFHHALLDPVEALKGQPDETEELIEQILAALGSDNLQAFIASASVLPSPEKMATTAQRAYLEANKLIDLDPYVIPNPGDAIMKISRDIEYSVYKLAERRHRAAEVLRILLAGDGLKGGASLVHAVVRGYAALDATFLSASQHRKSRAGRSFEYHIARLLSDGKVRYEEQAVTGGRRPDFVLPSLKKLNERGRNFDEAIVLSAKTTLRERWKQVTLEKFNCGLFLATVDDRISSSAIDDMYKQGIVLVIPESLKISKETCYKGKSNVITFSDFFKSEISVKRGKFV